MIAWRQWKTANDKLRLDLFEKRWRVYDAVKVILNKAAIEGQFTRDDLATFARGIEGAEFLFDGQIRDILLTIDSMCLRAQAQKKKQEKASGDLLERALDEEAEILTYLRQQASQIERLFVPYLGFRQAGLSR